MQFQNWKTFFPFIVNILFVFHINKVIYCGHFFQDKKPFNFNILQTASQAIVITSFSLQFFQLFRFVHQHKLYQEEPNKAQKGSFGHNKFHYSIMRHRCVTKGLSDFCMWLKIKLIIKSSRRPRFVSLKCTYKILKYPARRGKRGIGFQK